MTPEEQARMLAAWLDGEPGAEPPEGLDPEVVEAVYALRPELAPAPRVSADDILAQVTAGPLADEAGGPGATSSEIGGLGAASSETDGAGGPGATSSQAGEPGGSSATSSEAGDSADPADGPAEIVPFPDLTSQEPAAAPETAEPPPSRSSRRWVAGTVIGTGLALAAAALLTVRLATSPTADLAGDAVVAQREAAPPAAETEDLPVAEDEEQAPAVAGLDTDLPAAEDLDATLDDGAGPDLALRDRTADRMASARRAEPAPAPPPTARPAPRPQAEPRPSASAPLDDAVADLYAGAGDDGARDEAADAPADRDAEADEAYTFEDQELAGDAVADAPEERAPRVAEHREPAPDATGGEAPSGGSEAAVAKVDEAEPPPPPQASPEPQSEAQREQAEAVADAAPLGEEVEAEQPSAGAYGTEAADPAPADDGAEADEAEAADEQIELADKPPSTDDGEIATSSESRSGGLRGIFGGIGKKRKVESASAPEPAVDLDSLRAAAVPRDLPAGTLYQQTTDGVANVQANQQAAEGDYVEAANTLAEAVAPPLPQGQANAAQASQWLLIGDAPTDAASMASRGLALSTANTPHRSWLLVLRGDALRAQGDSAGAEAAYREAIRLNEARTPRIRDSSTTTGSER